MPGDSQKAPGSRGVDEFPGPDTPRGPPPCTRPLQRGAWVRAGRWPYPPLLLNTSFYFCLFSLVCVFPNLFTSVSPSFFSFLFFLIKEQSFL